MSNMSKILIFMILIGIVVWSFFQSNRIKLYRTAKDLGILRKNNVLKAGNCGGVLSCLSVRLDDFCEEYKSNDKILEIDSSSQFEPYKDYSTQDVSKLLLDPYNPNIKVPVSDFKHSWQFKNYKDINVEQLNKIAMNVCSPTDEVRNKAKEIYNIIGNRCVVFYRGNDKAIEIGAIPYDDVVKKAKELNEKSFYVQTDEREFYNYFKRHFPDSITYAGLPMISKNGTTFSTGNENELKSEFAIKFLGAVYAISKARRMIICTGNTGLWSVIYRGHLNEVYQLSGICEDEMYCDRVKKYYN